MTWPHPEKDSCIYALICPFTDKVKYIGKTENGITRIYGHWRDFRKSAISGRLTKKQNWVKKLRKLGVKFKVQYLEYQEDPQVLDQREIYWIAKYKSEGFDLLNTTAGGERTVTKIFTEEEKLEISRRTKEAMWRPEVRQKYLEGSKNRKVPSSYKTKPTKEKKQKISKSPWHESKKRKVVSSDGICFLSINDAAKHYKVTPAFVHKRCISTYCVKEPGFYFVDLNRNSLEHFETFTKTFKNPTHIVKIINSKNEIFYGATQAAKVYNLDRKKLKKELDTNGFYLDLRYYNE